LCETCHDPLEADRLSIDPLIRNCLDHLSDAEQRALERDLDLAFEIQQQLLPKNGVRFEQWAATYHYEPAGQVGGDYCDVIVPETGDGALHFFVGDVTGKGVGASILMGQLHVMFRSLVPTNLPLSELVARANRIFCEGTTLSHFATLVAGKASRNGKVEIVNAGHPAPVLVRPGGLQTVASTSLPIGIFCSSEYPTTSFSLSPGDKLVVYTDGLTEARNESEEQYGEERLTSLLTKHLDTPHREILGTCLHDLRTFRGNAAKVDDLTIFTLQHS
jgi:sigma-B regulation protein RsbU (phosphoserine phosphatase)